MGDLTQRLNFKTEFCISLENPTWVITIADSIYELLGFEADDFLTGKVTLQSLIHAHDQDIASYLFSSEMKPALGSFNIRLRHADGLIRCVKGEYAKVKDQTGNINMLKILIENAKSVWKQQVPELLSSSFRAMLENTDDFIYFKDNNHVFTADSQTLVSITNASNHWSELIGQTDYDVFPEKYADIYYALEKSVFARAKVAQDAQTNIDNSGNIGWVDNRKYPINNDDGEVVGLFGNARDITDQKMAKFGNINNDFRWRVADEGNNIEEHLILSHFEKIISSKIFATLKKQKRLLKYLVKESYAGRGSKLKAFTIAVEALGADSEYDPIHDSAVRVIVKRLRESLASYYISHDDEVIVKLYLPKGHYEITFLRKIPSSGQSDLKLERPDKRKGNDRRHE